MAELAVKDLTVEYDSGGYVTRPLHDFTFEADDGEFVAVVGPSGCGKTTMLSCLAGLLTPTSGSIRFRDLELTALSGDALGAYRRRTAGVVFQGFNLIPSLTARGNVMAPLRLAGASRRLAMTRAEELLTLVGLAEHMGRLPGRMSGGQQQRVAIARALAHEPPLVLADEPTAHLDHIQVEGILRLLRELAAPGRLVIVVTHDDRITHIADRVVELAPNFAVSDREPESLELAAGELVFRQGDRGDLVYVVEAGEVEVYLERSDGTTERLTVIGAGGYFGELGPTLNLPRSASVRALSTARLTGYPVRAFRRRFPSTAARARAGVGGDLSAAGAPSAPLVG
jgi:putative ABC transport system ATP-binding protein